MNQPSFLAVLSAFLPVTHLPGAEPKPQIAFPGTTTGDSIYFLVLVLAIVVSSRYSLFSGQHIYRSTGGGGGAFTRAAYRNPAAALEKQIPISTAVSKRWIGSSVWTQRIRRRITEVSAKPPASPRTLRPVDPSQQAEHKHK